MTRLLALVVLSAALAACASVLGIKPKEVQRPFEHRVHSLRGIACVECHQAMGRAGDDGQLHVPEPAKCVTCHEKPHDARACGTCHGQEHARDGAELAKRHLRFSHEKHLPTLAGQCVPCHMAAGAADQASMRPGMAQCFACHQHKEQWKTRECEGCHVALPAELVRPSSHVVHEGDFLREHGVRAASGRDLCATCHSESQCAACHGMTVPALPWRLDIARPQLTGTTNLHRAGFFQRHADESRANPGLCITCHGEGSYCTECHQKRRVGAAGIGAFASPHPTGWVRARGGEHGRAARIDPGSCATCHGGRGEALCVGCHKVGGPGGNPHGRGFASPLDRLRDEPCRQCHAP